MSMIDIIRDARRTDTYHVAVVPRALGIVIEDVTRQDEFPSLCYRPSEVRDNKSPVPYDEAKERLREWRKLNMYDVSPCVLVSLFDEPGLRALAMSLAADDGFRSVWRGVTGQPAGWLDGDVDREVSELADRIAEAADDGDIAFGPSVFG